MAKTATKIFSSGYRFKDGGVITAVLDENGKLSLRDESGGIELYQSWGHYVTDITGEKPVKGGEDDVLAQLGLTLGVPEEIIVDAGESRRTQTATKNVKEKGEETEVADAKKVVKSGAGNTAKPKPVKGAKAPKADKKPVKKISTVPAGDLPECLCGCGSKVLNAARQFLQGHDSRFHGYIKRIERGEMKASELTPAGRAYMRDHGITAGSNKG